MKNRETEIFVLSSCIERDGVSHLSERALHFVHLACLGLSVMAETELRTRRKTAAGSGTGANSTQQAQAKICECEYCNGTGYLSAEGKSVRANEHSPGWKYCPYCSRKLSAVR
jgi:hypothetical protein